MARSHYNMLPPQDLDAERAVLGSITLFEDVIDSVVAIITPEMFYLDAHIKIYSAMLQMRSERVRIDHITIAARLKANDHFEEVGGDDYLLKIFDIVPIAAHAAYYADIVRNKYLQRKVIYACTEAEKDAYQGSVDGKEIAERVADAMSKIAEDGQEQSGRWLEGVALDAMDRHLSEEPEGIPTGFTDIDSMTGGLKPQSLYIWAGRPGMGKTALVGNVAKNIAMASGPVAFFSLEMSESQLFDRMTAGAIGASLAELRNRARDNQDQVQDAVYALGALPIFVNANPSQSVASMLVQSRQIQRKRGLSAVIVDYLQLIEPEDRRAPREQQVGQISWRLKQMAKSLNVPVIALSQLSRACETRNDKKPVMADLRDSGQVEQNADSVAFIFRPAVYFPDEHKDSEAELLIPKNRFGKIGQVNLIWDGPTMTFSSFKEETSGFDDPFEGDSAVF